MAHDLLGGSVHRIGVAAVGVTVAAALVAGCSSSGGGTPSSNNNTSTSSGSTTASATTPASATGSSGSSSSIANVGSGFLSGFCKDYVTEGAKLSQAFANASQSGGSSALKAEVALFDKFASDAPSEIKSSFQTIAKALHDLEGGDYTKLQTDAPALSTAEQKIAAYFASGCH